MTFLNFSQLPESVFRPKLKENTFLETKPNFSLTRKCFPLTNFSMTNKHMKVWKMIFQKLLSEKQTPSVDDVSFASSYFSHHRGW
jgi:hypothetical protein